MTKQNGETEKDPRDEPIAGLEWRFYELEKDIEELKDFINKKLVKG